MAAATEEEEDYDPYTAMAAMDPHVGDMSHADPDESLPHMDPPSPIPTGGHDDVHPLAAQTYGPMANTFQALLQDDEQVEARRENVYHPFSCQTDWELAEWLVSVKASASDLDRFFKLKYVGPPPRRAPTAH